MNRPPNMPLPPPPTQAQAPPVPQSPAPKREVLSRAPHRPTDRSDDTPVLQSPAPKREVLSRAVRSLNNYLSHMCIAFVSHVVGIVDFVLDVYFYLLDSFCIFLYLTSSSTYSNFFSFFRLSLLIVYICVFNFCVWFVWYSVGYGALNNFCFILFG
jgi:hypothetical protein